MRTKEHKNTQSAKQTCQINNYTHQNTGWIENTCSNNTWLKYLVIRAVGHIEASQLDSNLIASGLAYCEGYFDYIGLWFLKNFLCNRDVQSQFNVGDVDPQSHRPMGRERLAILIEQLETEVQKKYSLTQGTHKSVLYF